MAGIDASELGGMGSVLTAGEAPDATGITEITSTGGTVTVTNPTGPITNLEVPAPVGFGGAPPAVAAASAAGVAGTASRSDHTHEGTSSVNGETGAVVLESTGGTVAITTPDATHINLEVATPAPGFGGAPPAIAAASAAGVAGTASRSDHTHAGTSSVNGATGAATVTAADAGIRIGGVAPALTVGQIIAAEWPLGIATRRVYLVDGVNGNDANVGFLDGGAAVFPISGATIAATALKTIEALAAILPRVGNYRACEIIIAAGTYTGSLAQLLAGVQGYQEKHPIIRGTATSATASCTAFDGSTNDNTFLGAVTVTGMNAAGYHPTGVPTNQVIPCLTVGGADPAFPAEPAAPLGWRVRFDAATATAALRNVCRMVSIVAEGGGVGTLTVATTLPAVPVAGDTFYLEQAGVNVAGGQVVSAGQQQATSGGFRSVQLAGIRCTTAFSGLGSGLYFCFCGLGVTGNSMDGGGYAADSTFLSADRGTITAGGGLVVTGTLFSLGAAIALKKIIVTGSTTLEFPTLLQYKEFVNGNFVQVTGCIGTDSTSVFCVGSENQAGTGQLPSRIIGATANPLQFINCKLVVGAIDIINAGARSCVLLNESDVFQHSATGGTALTGATGNTLVGMNLVGASTYTKSFASPHNTVTGSTGDVLVGAATSIVVSWAALETTGLVASTGDRVVGPAGPTTTIGKFSGAIVTSAVGATTSYLADSGSALAVANLATPQRYPTSLRLVTRLRAVVSAVSGTLSNTVTATLYKNNVATTMQVSIPSGSVAGAAFLDSVHPILFQDGDTFDVRLDDAGADAAAGTLAVSATLEGPV